MENSQHVKKAVGVRGLFKRIFLITQFLMITTLVVAQNISVSGTVIDNRGDAVIGASVIVEGTTNGSMTDMDGNFTLSNVPSTGTLSVSYIGYEALKVKVDKKSIHRVTLKESEQKLDEVVVIGYGSVKRSTLTSAVAKMDSKGIENRPLARAETALQGQLAGVTVRTTTGEPGADMQIRVRGAASINASSDPLYVVDGMPITTLSGISPADIESIEVLKDAASSAIYGSRGSNGVVIVSTKKGKTGKPRITLNASYGVQSLEKKMDLLTGTEWMDFKMRWNDQNYLAQAASLKVPNASIKDNNALRLQNVNVKPGTANANLYTLDDRWFNYMSDDVRAAHTYTQNPEQLSLLDWQNEFFRSAPIQDYNLNVAGGTDNANYLLSGGYMKQEGIARGTDYERFTFRANIDTKINKYVSAGINLAPTYIRSNGGGRANGKDSRIHHVLSSTPVSEPGVGYMTNVEPNDKYFWAGSASSPIYFMEKNIRTDETVRLLGNAFVRVTPLDGLKIELSGSVNYADLEGSTYTYSSTSGNWAQGEGQNSSGSHNTARSWSTLLQALANYDKTFGKHGISAMLGASSEESSVGFKTEQTFNKPFPNDAIVYSFDGATIPIGKSTVEQATPNRLASFFGRFQYNYDERYMVSASLRADGGSVFGGNNKWGIFPALSGGWNITNEQFFKDLDLSWWNTLKLRASYGATGNNSIAYDAAYATLDAISYAGLPGYYANTLANPNLGWEKTHSTDVALDLAFLSNKIQLSVDWYTKNTVDLLYKVPALGVSGFSTMWDNLGDIRNQGVEVELNTRNLSGPLTWTTSFNVSYNQNKVLSIGTDNAPIDGGFDKSNYSNQLKVGTSANSFYMYDAVGVWKSQKEIDDFSAKHDGQKVTFEGKTIKPGDIRYRDVNNDGIFDKANDRDYLGSPTPTMIYGMTNNLSYKNFDLSVLLTAQTGGKIFGVIGRAIDRPGMGALSNVMGRWRDAWWSEAEPGNGSVPYILSTTTGTALDSRWLYSSDYLRIKNITIGYKIPVNPKILPFARVYVSIENLAKWDSYYGGFSPEAANTASSDSPGGQSALGLDYSGYPIPRIVTFGANISF